MLITQEQLDEISVRIGKGEYLKEDVERLIKSRFSEDRLKTHPLEREAGYFGNTPEGECIARGVVRALISHEIEKLTQLLKEAAERGEIKGCSGTWKLDPAVFNCAPSYHSGGITSGEVPQILSKGEIEHVTPSSAVKVFVSDLAEEAEAHVINIIIERSFPKE